MKVAFVPTLYQAELPGKPLPERDLNPRLSDLLEVTLNSASSERPAGIEPAMTGWEPVALPLGYGRSYSIFMIPEIQIMFTFSAISSGVFPLVSTTMLCSAPKTRIASAKLPSLLTTKPSLSTVSPEYAGPL